MISEKRYMAIDVGTTKVCTLIARVGSEGELEVVGTGVAPSQGMRKGLVVGLEDMKEAVASSVEMASGFLDDNLPKACVGVTGVHISSTHTTASLTNGKEDGGTISVREVEQLIKQSRPKVSTDQELLHVIPQSFHVDSLQGVRNPVGLSGKKLAVESHAVVGEVASLDNVARAVEGAGLSVGSMVLESLASAEAVLSGDEKQLGVLLVDIGGGTTDIALFSEGVMAYTAVIPVAGFQFTNDLVISCGIPYSVAEEAKLKAGHALPDMVDQDEMVEVVGAEDGLTYRIRRRELCRTLHDRAAELLHLVLLKVREAGMAKIPPGGVVFTGGAANLAGFETLAQEILPGPVRITPPRDILGLPEALRSPTYSTSVGILLWGIRHPVEQDAYDYRNRNKPFGKGRRWLRWISKFIGSVNQNNS